MNQKRSVNNLLFSLYSVFIDACAKNFQLLYCFSRQLLIKHTDSVSPCSSGKLKSMVLTSGSCINGDMVIQNILKSLTDNLLFSYFVTLLFLSYAYIVDLWVKKSSKFRHNISLKGVILSVYFFYGSTLSQAIY